MLVLRPDGPGTTVILKDGARGLPVAPRGTVAVLGQFASGPTTHAAIALNSGAARKIAGDPNDDFEASLAMSDVYHFASPPVLIGRVTDGLEVQSRAWLWDRNPLRSYLHRVAQPDRAPFATAYAHNGGRWAGRKRIFVTGTALTLSSALTSETTLATGRTMLKNVFAGANCYFTGDNAGPYKIISNTTAGVLTFERSVGQDVIDASDGISNGVNGHVYIDLDYDVAMSVVVGEDSSVTESFSLHAVRQFTQGGDYERVAHYGDLKLSTSDDRPWITTIYDGEEINGNYQIAVTSDYSGATLEQKFPANLCEIPIAISGETLTFQWYRWSAASTNTGNPYLDSISVNNSSQVVPHVITVTFTAATTATVTVTFMDGSSTTFATSGLTLGSNYTCGAHGALCTFKLKAGSTTAASGDVITIRVNTIPQDLHLREAFLYPVAVSDDGNSTTRLRIVSCTYNSVSVRTGVNLATYGSQVAASPEMVGSADLTSATWTSGQTIILTPDGGASVTFTGSGESGWTAIKAALEAADTNDIFTFDADDDGYIVIGLQQSRGSGSKIAVGNGTANATFGLTNGDVTTGDDAIPFRIEGRFPMWGGYDGDTPSAARYALAVDADQHLFRRHMQENLGLVRVITPGQTSATVKTAAEAFVCRHGWKYMAEFASSIESSSDPVADAVSDMLANEAESDYVDHVFPSRGKFRNTTGTKLVTRSVSGVYAGLKAKMAAQGVDGERGFHIAIANANEQGMASPRVLGLSDQIGRWTPSSIRLANDHGIVLLMWSGQDVYFWGNRMYSKGRTSAGARYTITERDVYYHVARDLFVTTRPFIFKSISASRLGSINSALRAKMNVYWRDGWFSDHAGAGFDDQVYIALPPELNTPAALLEGNVSAVVKFRPRPALENLTIVISPTEVSEG